MAIGGAYYEFYREFFHDLKPNQAGECKVKGFCHDDQHESMAVNVNNGLFNCFACDEVGGDAVDFYILWKDRMDGVKISFKAAKAYVGVKTGIDFDERKKQTQGGEYHRAKREAADEMPPIPPKKIEKWHEMLLNNPMQLKYLKDDRGLTIETIKKHMLGYDGERITIPIYNDKGDIVNVRKYLKGGKGKDKMISYAEGYGAARLFPLQSLQHKDVMVNEGEWDAMLAEQMGFHSFTVTGGAGTWEEEFTELLRDKNVVICYDIDKAGKQGANRVAHEILEVANSVKILILPIVEIPNGDYSDFVTKQGATKQTIDRLIEDTPEIKREQGTNKDTSNDPIHVHLSEASQAQYDGKRITMNVIVAGKDTQPYLVPKKIHVKCPSDNDKCQMCKMNGVGLAGKTIDINPTERQLLLIVEASDRKKKYEIADMAGITQACNNWEFEILESQNVEKVILMPELDFSSKEQEYVLTTAYVVGSGIQTNTSYTLEGTTVADPWTQKATQIIDKYQTKEDNVASFKLTPEIAESLKIFKSREGQTVKEKFDDIHQDLSHNITRIYGRDDIMTATDLTFHSVLEFDFQGKTERRGWVESLVIGDTRTGKSDTILSLREHYHMGEFITGENVSYAGLIGGLQQSSSKGKWTITWGKIPLNDRRLIIIDEASGIPTEQIERMSGVRSSGIAEITKIHTERTHARTRLIWISNDREGRGLSHYSFGTDAVLQLIGKAEDIARFELVVSAGKDEVDLSIINKKITERADIEHVYSSELCRDLILWAWSRTKDQIKFTPEAIDLLFKYATEQGNFYTNKVPIVEGANQRIKLARMAIATAARVYSTDDTGEMIIVKPEHVEYVYDFLTEIYKKQSLGYWDLSKQAYSQREKAESCTGEVKAFLSDFPDLADIFMENNIISVSDIGNILNVEPFEARKYINMLMKSRMVTKGTTNGYRKTPTFISIIREWKQENGM